MRKVLDAALLGGDRRDLRLREADIALIGAVASRNARTVVIAGGTMVLDPWDQEVGAILLDWYPGMKGGRALADLLLGDAEPGGRPWSSLYARRTCLDRCPEETRSSRF